MAASLGSLVVSLGLDAAEFTTGLTKSEYEAKRFAQRLDSAISTGAKAAGVAILGIGAAAVTAFHAVNELARQAGDFKPLAESTGIGAEALASFAVAAGTAGIAMRDVAGLSVKLTKNLTGVDDESKAAGAAVEALGLNLKDFKALDPAAQMLEIAKAFASFEDGGGKTAAAVALLGKSGAEAIPFLNKLGGEIGQVTILTQAQIERADAYSDAQAKARTQLNLYAQAAATEMLPALTALTGAAKDFIVELLGLDNAGKGLRDSNAIAEFANNSVRALGFIADSADSIGRIFRVVGNVIGATAAQIGALADGDLKRYNAIQKDASDTIDAIISKQTLRFRIEKNIADQARAADTAARGPKAPGKQVNFSGAVKADKGGADRISEAQRFLDSLQKQVDRTLELTAVETALKEIQSGRLKGLTPEIEKQILVIAAQIDAYKELEDWIKKSGKAFDEEKRALDDAAKARERVTDAAFKEAENIAAANNNLRDEIAIITGGEAARKAIEKARVSSAIAIKEEALAMAQLDPLRAGEAAALQSQITLLKERSALLGQKDFAEALAADAANLQQFKDLFTDTFANAFSSIVDGSKSAKEAFKDFEKSILQSLSRIASQNLAESLFGGKSSGGGFDLGKLFGSIGAGGGGGFDFGQFLSLFGQKLGFSANGTSFAAGGPMMVGERGPEVVNLPRGASVTPNHAMGSGKASLSIVQNINVMPGASTQTGRQAAAAAGRSVRGALARG